MSWSGIAAAPEEVEEDEEDVPAVAEFIDERPDAVKLMEEFPTNSKWKLLGDQNEDSQSWDISGPAKSPMRQQRHDCPEPPAPGGKHNSSLELCARDSSVTTPLSRPLPGDDVLAPLSRHLPGSSSVMTPLSRPLPGGNVRICHLRERSGGPQVGEGAEGKDGLCPPGRPSTGHGVPWSTARIAGTLRHLPRRLT